MEVISKPSLIWYLLAYAIIMVFLGIRSSQKINNSEDFILAGRGLGAFVLMGTLIATWCGSGTITGGPNSLAYSYGFWTAVSQSSVEVIGILFLVIIANKIRENGKYTISEILQEKYGEGARILSVIIIVMAYLGIVSYQYKGLGYILNVATGIDVELATILGTILIIFLATVGGLMSVALTDAMSAFFIVIGVIIGAPVAMSMAGGWDNAMATLPKDSSILGGLTPLQFIGYIVPALFLLLGDQNMYQRLSASKGKNETKLGAIGWLIGILVIYPAVAVIAFAARVNFPDINPGMALIATTTIMPTFIGGLMLAAAAAFIVTTGNSFLLSAATSVTYDIYGRYINPSASEEKKLKIIKIIIPILGVLAFIIINYFSQILEVQMYAYTVYGAGITPAVLAVFLWKDVTKEAGISSMLVGVTTTLVWEIILKKPMDLNSSVVSIPIAIITIIIVTFLTRNKNKTSNIHEVNG
ncbi:sodium:solute symporter family protein [Thermohalobacter berrensis]|uniref:Sodium:proline symporter n=1 Tax=Thermohalobacter berrensis TaxID=99594 RepID=A0A419T8U0_9FIRM|nr:sodium:solute symporter family protein [Thermohalobacter berrensis]RKD33806.1 sodium:proline symporter [Thermohalobacter berrensis]